MKKSIISVLLVLVMLFGMLPTAAFAADSVEEALGEIDIYNGGVTMSYLSINGRNRELIYTYYNYIDRNGQTREIPAYCVNPNITGVPQSVPEGESIKYIAEQRGSDPKVVGIVANGYPTRGLQELGLENKYHAYYATKMALWCYLLSNWDINNLKVNPSLTGVELQRANQILAAAKDIYRRGTSWTKVLTPGIVSEADQDVAYPVTVDGQDYYQQVFTVTSETWVCDYIINVAFSDPSAVPEGTKIVDMNNREISQIITEGTGNGYAGKFKVLYPAESIEGESGSVQLSFKTNVYKYGVYYAVCAETDQYGNLQNYMVDTDPTIPLNLTAYSTYTSDPEQDTPETSLKIIKLESGTEIPLRGAVFEVVDPEGATIGTFATDSRGEIVIPLYLAGNYTVYERSAPQGYLLSEEPAQNVTVLYGEQATLTFENDPYGALEVRKYSNTGMALNGAVIQIEHIETGAKYTQETGSAGVAIFDELQPGAYRITEIESPDGYLKDDTVYTQTVVPGDTVSVPIVNEEKPGLRILKYDSMTQEALPDITFEIFKDTQSLGQYTTDQFGEILLTDLDPGTYLVKEIATDESHNLVRFADDILITVRTMDDAEIALGTVRNFLAERGLSLSEEKTKVCNIDDGFTFLSRTYVRKNGLIYSYPSDAAVDRFISELKNIIMTSRKSQRDLINTLNRKLKGWAGYHRYSDAGDAFRKVDVAVQTALLEAAIKKHPRLAIAKVKAKYWYREPNGRHCYALPDDKSVRVVRLADTLLITHHKVNTNANPFVGDAYMEHRTHSRQIENVAGPYRAIWLRQNGRCYYCGRPILPDQPRTTVQLDLSRPPSIRNSAYIHKICEANEFEQIRVMEDFEFIKPFDVCLALEEIQGSTPKGVRVKKDIAPGWKHYGLKQYLSKCSASSVTLTFSEIEKIDGLPLAASARKNKDWWYPRDNCNTIAEAWLTEGYSLVSVDFQKQKVSLRRDDDGMSKLVIPKVLTEGKIPDNARFELETHMEYIIKKYGL